MPERILRDLTDSDHYNAASANGRDLFIRLMNKADDYGLLVADARRLRPLLYPLLIDKVREADLQRWIAECEKAGLIRLYTVDGRDYLQVQRWGAQRLRNKKAKCPLPPWGIENPSDNPPHPQCSRTASAVQSPTDTDTDTDTDTEPPTPKGADVLAGFKRFWDEWPDHHRKEARKQCESHWKSNRLEDESEAVLRCLRRWKSSESWSKLNGQFIPAPLPWLRKANWKSAAPPPMNGTPANKPLTGVQVYDQEADQ